ncbi:MAG: carbohydrate kinase [Spirochaetaceae bacterium]|jgi:sugar/nucleoside kinase (ribokinase family)|nr:carbohydrate kinase [Spirochaetaceae bacterium]
MDTAADILCIGEIVIDFTPGREEASYVRHAGGAPANVAIAFSRMGGRAAFCGKVGDDLFGEYLLGVLRDNHVLVWCGEPAKEAVTTMTFVSLTAGGNRSFTFAQKTGAHLFLDKTDITPAMLQRVKLVHTGSSILAGGTAPEAILHALKMAATKGLLVSFDLNYRALQWKSPQDCRDQVAAVLPYVDFLKVSNEESFLFGGDQELPRIMEQYDIPLLVLTRGAGPSSVFWKGQEWQRPSVRKNAVDTTGAGDAFWGTFLYTLLSAGVQKREDLCEACITGALRYGVAAGELAILKPGAIPSLPLKTEVEEALALYE